MLARSVIRATKHQLFLRDRKWGCERECDRKRGNGHGMGWLTIWRGGDKTEKCDWCGEFLGWILSAKESAFCLLRQNMIRKLNFTNQPLFHLFRRNDYEEVKEDEKTGGREEEEK